MSAGARVAVAGPSIPANARKVVQDLKEIVKNSEDEIYAMLKDCNMDPNETVQRLLSQDTFHEVKRKRDKKKENVNKESGESRSRPSGVGFSVRGGRVPDRGTGRGNYITRYNSEFNGGGRGQPFSGRDDGSYQNARASSTTPALVHPKSGSTGTSGSNTVVAVTSSGLAGLPNGSSPYPRTALVPHRSWSVGPGQATMADIVKSKNAQQYDSVAAPISKGSRPEQVNSLSSNMSAGVYSPSTDSMLHSCLESHGMGPVGIKQDVGMVRSQTSIEEHAPVLSIEDSPIVDSSKQSPQISQLSTDGFGAFSSESGGTAGDSDIAPTSILCSFSEEPKISQLPSMEVVGSSEGASFTSSLGPPGPAVSRGTLIANTYNGRAMYQTQQQPVGSQKGSGLEWKPKSPVQSRVSSQAAVEASSLREAAISSPPASPEDSTRTLVDSTLKLQRFSMQDDQPVIIPNHLQVPEADRTHLSFGSFGEDFDTPFPSNFTREDDTKNSAFVADKASSIEAQAEQPTASSLQSSTLVSLEENDTNLSTVSPVEALVGGDDVGISMPAPVVSTLASRAEVLKAEPVVHQSQQYPYLSAMPSYPGFGVMPQLVSGQYTYEPAESQPQEVSRLPSFVSHYSDPGVNYYSPVFRPGSDVDARYNHLVSTNATNKYTGGTLITGQGLSSSQEGGNSIVIPASGPTGQTSQTVGVAQTGLSMPQQPVQIHAYPAQHAGVPFTPFGASVFGFQYVPSSYGYMPTPYQHSYTGNTGYPQVPSGSSYAPAAASAYTPTGGAAIKYSLPQYKPGAAVVNTPHTALAAGYGSFTTSPTGFTAVNPAVTTVNASGYDDVSGRQYKENNLYIPSQQAEGSTVWIQTPLSRDAGVQTNSFYNMLGQGQHTGYAHAQPTHAVPAAAYANLYHQSQSGTAPTVQLLQQPQALGAIGGGVAQSGAYPQPQRGQLSWTNNY